MVKFLRRVTHRHSKLGKGRKKKQTWRSPKGRDNKMREKRKGYSPVVSIGYGTEKKTRGQIKGKSPVLVNNLKDIEKMEKDQIVIIGNVGKKKKIEFAKKLKEKGIEILNINVKKLLKKPKEKKNESK